MSNDDPYFISFRNILVLEEYKRKDQISIKFVCESLDYENLIDYIFVNYPKDLERYLPKIEFLRILDSLGIKFSKKLRDYKNQSDAADIYAMMFKQTANYHKMIYAQ